MKDYLSDDFDPDLIRPRPDENRGPRFDARTLLAIEQAEERLRRSGIFPPGREFSVEQAIHFIGDRPLSETLMAYALEDQLHDIVHFMPESGVWRVFDGVLWRDRGRGVVRAMLAQLAYESSAGATKYSSASFASGGEQAASWLFARRQAGAPRKWNADPYLLGTPKWTVSLKGLDPTLLRPRAEHGITMSTAVTPNDAPAPKWDAFLTDLTGGDDALRDYLWRGAGYALTGDVSEHALFFAFGDGGNGKGTFINTLLGIMGDYGHAAPMEVFMASIGDRHPTELAALEGKRLVVSSETEEGRHFADARIKTLTGGDPITARRMRQDQFTFSPQFKLWLMGNHQPALKSVGDAMRRRVHMIPFVHTPKVVNKHLMDELREEWPEILSWMIEGAWEWEQRGLEAPRVVRAASDAYFDEQDVFGQWIADCCIVDLEDRDGGTEPSTLFASWKAYAEKTGKKPGTLNRFAEAIARHGVVRERRTVNGATRRIYLGVRLRVGAILGESMDSVDDVDSHLGFGASHARAREFENEDSLSTSASRPEQTDWWPDDD